jgi:hypothetical protein
MTNGLHPVQFAIRHFIETFPNRTQIIRVHLCRFVVNWFGNYGFKKTGFALS